jgi:hypothetical protein
MEIDVTMSARMGRRAELRRYRTDLARAGYRVVSSWLDSEVDDADLDSKTLGEQQVRNLEEIDRSTLHVVFTDPPGEEVVGATRGTRHFDAGYAWSLQRVVIVGPRENAAHHIPDVEVYPTWGAFYEALTGMKLPVDDDLGLDRIES